MATVSTFPDSYRLRLERVGAYSERDQHNEAFRRTRLAGMLRARLDQTRQSRAMGRSSREREATEQHKRELYQRRQRILQPRLAAIIARVEAENRIRPAGKSLASRRRYNTQIEEALSRDSQYRAFREHNTWFAGFLRRLGFHDWIAAGVLAIDDRRTRHAKVRAYRQATGSGPPS
jgi:hypothetical protein